MFYYEDEERNEKGLDFFSAFALLNTMRRY